MGAAAYFTSEWLRTVLPGGQWYVRAVRVFGAIAPAVLVLLAAARALGISELRGAMDRVFRRLSRR